MENDLDRCRRKTIRLQGYDYSRAGAYFVTVCTRNRACLFGRVANGQMMLNDAGRTVEKWYRELENKYTNIRCDQFVCMPNHTHFIVVIVGADLCVRLDSNQTVPNNRTDAVHGQTDAVHGQTDAVHGQTDAVHGQTDAVRRQTDAVRRQTGAHIGAPLRGAALPAIVQWFKTMTTNEYIRGVKQQGWLPFRGKLWQRNYYEHIVRNDGELDRIRKYIMNNPMQWSFDRENPEREFNVAGSAQRRGRTEIRETLNPYGQISEEEWMI